jgi:hypothetical protein
MVPWIFTATPVKSCVVDINATATAEPEAPIKITLPPAEPRKNSEVVPAGKVED